MTEGDHLEYVREMKEQMCSVAIDYRHSLSQRDPLTDEERSYELPDETVLKLDHHQRFLATELLFNPQLCGSMNPGLAQMAYRSIEKCDNDLKINLYNSVVLAGGTSLLPGF